MTYSRLLRGESEKPAVGGSVKLRDINHLRKLYNKELNEQTSLSLVSSCSSKIEDLDSHTVEGDSYNILQRKEKEKPADWGFNGGLVKFTGINDWSNQRVKELHKQVLSDEEFLEWLSVVCSEKNNEDTVEEGEDTKKGSVIPDQDISDQVKPQYHVTQQQVLGNCNSKPEVKLPETKLDPRIAYFVSLIFNASGIETGGYL